MKKFNDGNFYGNKFPERASVAVRWDAIMRRDEAPPISERISTRMVRIAAHLPEGEFVGWQMEVPTIGLAVLESFGTSAVKVSDLEWIAGAAAKTSVIAAGEAGVGCAIGAGAAQVGGWELYEIQLAAEQSHLPGSIGFSAERSAGRERACADTGGAPAGAGGPPAGAGVERAGTGGTPAAAVVEPADSGAKGAGYAGWPMHFTRQFGELVRALREEGGILRYAAGSATPAERRACRKAVADTWAGDPAGAAEYIGSPVRAKILLMLPGAPSARLRAVVCEAAPGAELRRAGSASEAGAREIWGNPMSAPRILPDAAARILLMEPLIGGRPIVGVGTCLAAARPIPAGHENTKARRAIKIGAAIGADGHMRGIAVSDADMRRHWQIVGQTGTGKSTLLAAALREAILQGRGLTFFDPHGTTIAALLKTIPEKHAARIRVAHIGDRDSAVPISMWGSDDPEECEKTISDLNMLFAEIFDPKREGIVGPRWERWFSVIASAAISLLGRKASFDSMIALSQSRDSLNKLASAVLWVNPKASRALLEEYVNDKSSEFASLINWCVSKLQRLVSVPQLRDTLGSGANALDFGRAIDTDAVTLVDLASPEIGTHAARVVGTLLLQQLWGAATARRARDATHIVAIDEAHLFQTSPLPQMLAEGRKFGVAMILAHQHCGQLSREVREALDANSANFSAFRLSARDSAEALPKLGDESLGWELCRLNAFRAITTLSVDGRQTPAFTLQVAKPRVRRSGASTAALIEGRSKKELVLPYRDCRPLSQEDVRKILGEKARDPDGRPAGAMQRDDSKYGTYDYDYDEEWLASMLGE
ncbi:MAG: DUF87 domain-containing protein, partial [Clostridiales bacterium]|nr:DUF87 domain-containing protein [Clostridiales bacterium]